MAADWLRELASTGYERESGGSPPNPSSVPSGSR